ncbi:MAG: toll/interleukin-1 receptor domain-containing protein [Lachnospiraceae bacterium]|nr:toll/interleukin-1 receptor domain-containing protein [Lachnospiraceae bacterium]
MMEKDKIIYDAFISYRHSEPDSFVAETLHRQLESFKLPRNVARRKIAQVGEGEEGNQAEEDSAAMLVNKTRIQRVFRDKEELPLATNLADPITEALENSEYLIVICSPRLPESMWCRKEIETFIEMHDREHVLAVLVEGEPDTSFPEELLYRDVEETQPDGSVIKKRIPVEPLAADVRGADRREMRKKIKSELLRLVAPMFDCNYDDLKQRHKEQRIRKIVATSVSISAACLLFGIVSTTMALRIRHQNTQIKEQNTQIQAQADEIAAQAREIEAQYREAKRNTAISRANEAERYLEEGDRLRAIAIAQDALLDLSDGNGIEEGVDYPAQAIYALTDSLYLYENGQQILPDRILETDTTIRIMKLSPQGSRILTVDASGQMVVWQPDDTNARIVFDMMYNGISSGMEKEIAFFGEDGVFCPVEDGVALYDLSGGSTAEAYRISCTGYVGIIVLQEQKWAIVLTDEWYRAIDCADGSTIYEEQWDMDGLAARALTEFVCSEDGRYWAVTLSSPYTDSEERRVVAVYDAMSGAGLNSYPIDYEYVESVIFDEDRIYIASNRNAGTDTVLGTLDMEGHLQAFEIYGSSEPVWTYERHSGWLYDIACGQNDNSEYLLCSGYSDVVVLDKRDGSYIDIFALGVEVTELWYANTNELFMAFTRDGVWHYLNLERREDMVGMLFPACTSTNVKEFDIGSGYCVTLPYNSRQVTVYKTARGVGVEAFHESDVYYATSVFSGDGTYMAVRFYNDSYSTAVELFDTGTGERLWRYEDDSSYKSMMFVDCDGQEMLALLTSKQMLILEPKTGTCLKSAILERDGSFDYIGCDREHRRLVLRSSHALYVFDLDDMSSIHEIQLENGLGYNDIVAAADDLEFYAVADKKENILRFYREGEEFFTYDGGADPLQPGYINFQYIETMFFNEYQQERHLYIVYKDGRITELDIAQDLNSTSFCTADSRTQNPEKYNGLESVMNGYTYAEGDDYALLWGSVDAYLLTAQDGEILAHLHGLLGYDSVHAQIYLVNGRTIYRMPLYTLEEINSFATDVRQTGQW